MDYIQAYVYQTIPQLTFGQALLFFMYMMVVWFFSFLSFYLVTPVMIQFLGSCFPILNKFNSLDRVKKLQLTIILNASFVNMLLHAAVIYGLLYANGIKGKSWFNDNKYRETAYDFQIYTTLSMLAFFAVETIVLPMYLPYKKYIEVVIHHLLSSSL